MSARCGATASRAADRRAATAAYRAAGLIAASSLSACTGPQDFMRTAGPAAGDLAVLGWLTLVVFSIVAALIWLLLLFIAQRRQGSFDAHAPVEVSDGQRWIVIGGFAIPTAILATLFVLMLGSMRAFPMAAGTQHEPEIRIVGRQWWFGAQYLRDGSYPEFEVPTELHMPVGRPVDIELVTRDVIHSFWAPKLHGKVDLVPGMVNRMRIQIDEAGTYEGECAEYCGAQHAHMRLRVIAQSEASYAQWLAAQRASARAPRSTQAMHGQRLFVRGGCPLCHTVRGTGAAGSVGPDLTHVASRQRIAGGMLVNNTANLAAWIRDAPSLKPGTRMPAMDLSGEQLRAVVAYLQTLE